MIKKSVYFQSATVILTSYNLSKKFGKVFSSLSPTYSSCREMIVGVFRDVLLYNFLFIFYKFFSVSILISIFVLSSFSLKSQNIYDLEHSLQYASYLEKNKEYKLAAEEYERINFLNPSIDSLKLKLIQLYVKADSLGMAEKRLNNYFSDLSKMPVPFAKEYSRILFKKDRFDEAFSLIKLNRNLTSADKNLLSLHASLFQYNFADASKILDNVDTQKIANLPEYKNLIALGLNTRYKSPVLALGLSTLVPGLGKIYTKNYYDGIITFAFVGLSAFEAYRGFGKRGKRSMYGWISSGLAIGFYTGSLYGSFKAAKNYNKKLKQRFYEKAENLFNRAF